MGKKVVTLGEIMLRLSTPGNTRFVQSDSFDVVYGCLLYTSSLQSDFCCHLNKCF